MNQIKIKRGGKGTRSPWIRVFGLSRQDLDFLATALSTERQTCSPTFTDATSQPASDAVDAFQQPRHAVVVSAAMCLVGGGVGACVLTCTLRSSSAMATILHHQSGPATSLTSQRCHPLIHPDMSSTQTKATPASALPRARPVRSAATSAGPLVTHMAAHETRQSQTESEYESEGEGESALVLERDSSPVFGTLARPPCHVDHRPAADTGSSDSHESMYQCAIFLACTHIS